MGRQLPAVPTAVTAASQQIERSAPDVARQIRWSRPPAASLALHYGRNLNALVRAGDYVRSAMSLVRVIPQAMQGSEWGECEDPFVTRVAAQVQGIDWGRSAQNVMLTGESWITGQWAARAKMGWRVGSIEEVRWSAGDMAPPRWHTYGDPLGVPLWDAFAPEATRPTLLRVFYPDVAYGDVPSSTLLGDQAQMICEELLLIQIAELIAQKSRLSNGILYIPTEIVGAVRMLSLNGQLITDRSIRERLEDQIIGPIEDRNSPAGVVPLMLYGPAGAASGIQHLTFEKLTDPAKFIAKNEALIKELAMLLPVPEMVLRGLTDSNHWNGALEDDNAVKFYWGPMAALQCDSVTDRWFRPYLEACRRIGVWNGDPWQYRLFGDTGRLAERPADATVQTGLYDRGIIGAKHVRASLAIPESAAPDAEEQKQWSISTGKPLTPPTVPAPAVLPVPVPNTDPTQALSAPAPAPQLPPAPVPAAVTAPRTFGVRLKDIGKAAFESGTKANLADLAVGRDHPFEGLGFGRDEMPQLDGARHEKFLASLGPIVTPEQVDPFTLKATQSELSAAKAYEISLDPAVIDADPFIVSNDGYLLDGHHRWVAAIMNENTTVEVMRVDETIQVLMAAAQDFSGRPKAFVARRVIDIDPASVLVRLQAAAAPVVAARAAKSVQTQLDDIARELNAIDNEARTALLTLCDASLASTLRAIGRKVVQESKGRDPWHQAVAACAPKGSDLLWALDVPGVVAGLQLGRDAEEKIGIGLRGFVAHAARIMTDAARKARAVIASRTPAGVRVPEPELDIDRAAQDLHDHLAALCLARAHSTVEGGEDRAITPMQVVAAAVAVAGGWVVTRGKTDGTRGEPVSTKIPRSSPGSQEQARPAGGIAVTPSTQQQVETILRERIDALRPEVATVTTVWTWYHDHPKNPFRPHVALHGVTASEATGLREFGGWFPGDHAHCLCHLQPRYVLSS